MSSVAARKSRPSRLGPWNVQPERTITLRPNAQDALSIGPKAARLVAALGLNAAAALLDVDRSQLRRCIRGDEPFHLELARRISAVEYLLDRALHVMHADEVGPWLAAPEPLLGDRLPINVLIRQGPEPVVAALDGIFAGVLA